MKPLSEQSYYETLEVLPTASPEEIERAYKIMLTTYAPDSLAGYSVFEEGDSELLRERVEIAYRVLSDPGERDQYDAQLQTSEGEEPGDVSGSDPSTFATSAAPRTANAPAALQPTDDLPDLDEGPGPWDGARLRRARLQQGVELEQIADVTKVNPTYLQFIEEDRFEGLPAAVYVRGFVMGYAGCLGMDPQRVAGSYMQRFESSHDTGKRRLFSRR